MKGSRWLATALPALWRPALASTFLSAIAAALGLYLITDIGAIMTGAPGKSDFLTSSLLLVLLLALTLLARGILSRQVQDLTYHVRKDLVRRIMACSMQRFEHISAAKIYATLATDVQNISSALGQIPIALFNGLLLLFGTVYIIALSPPAALVIALTTLVSVVVTLLIQRNAMHTMRSQRVVQGKLFRAYESMAYGKKEFMLSTLRRERFLDHDMEKLLQDYRATLMRADLHWELVSAWSEGSMLLLLLILAALSPRLGIDSATLAQVALTLFYLRGPISIFLDCAQRWSHASIALKNIVDLRLDSEAAVPTLPAPLSIEYRDITFSYRDESGEAQFVVGPVSLILAAGEVAFITGGNGSGKSSLCKMITGLYQPEAGQVLFDGQALASGIPLRQHAIGLFSDYFAFDSLPMAQQQLDRPRLTQIGAWLSSLRLAHKTGLDGVQWNVTKLSTGQQRRLALISTLCEEKTLFLFDEPTADQDPDMRRHFYEEVVPSLRAQGKIVVIISHDESYFHCADRLYTLADGRLVPQRGSGAPLRAAPAEQPAETHAEHEYTAELDAAQGGTAIQRRIGWVLPALLVAALFSLLPDVVAAAPTFSGAGARDALGTVLTPAQAAHPTGSVANVRVGHAIASQLAGQGWQPEWQTTTQCGQRSCTSLANLVVSHLPAPGQPALLLAAHYDSAPSGPGAADNGIGVGVLIEFARVLKGTPDAPNVILLFTDAEELGRIGAQAFMQRHPLRDRIGFVVNIDSIGHGGPLTAYDLGADPGRSTHMLAAAPSTLLQSSFLGAVGKLAPHATDLSVFSAHQIPGVGIGYLARGNDYHLSGDRIEVLGSHQFQAVGDTLLAVLAAFPAAAVAVPADSAPYLLALTPALGVALPAPLLWGAFAVGWVALAWRLRRCGRAGSKQALQGTAWLGLALLVAGVFAFLFSIGLSGLHVGPFGQRVWLPLCAPLAFWAVLGVAARGRLLDEALPLLGMSAAAVCVLLGSALAPTLIIIMSPLAVWRALAPTATGAACALGLALTALAIGSLLYLSTQAAGEFVVSLSAMLWVLAWLPLAPLFGRANRASAALLGSALVLTLVLQGFACAWLLSPEPMRLRVDRIERLDQGVALAMLDDTGEPARKLGLKGFEDGAPPPMPWSGAARQYTLQLDCCRTAPLIGATRRELGALTLDLRAHPDVLGFSFFFPARAGLREVQVGEHTVQLDPAPQRGLNGYSYFGLRDGLGLHQSLRFEFANPDSAAGAYMVAERSAGATLRRHLDGLPAAHQMNYVPDRILSVESIPSPYEVPHAQP